MEWKLIEVLGILGGLALVVVINHGLAVFDCRGSPDQQLTLLISKDECVMKLEWVLSEYRYEIAFDELGLILDVFTLLLARKNDHGQLGDEATR